MKIRCLIIPVIAAVVMIGLSPSSYAAVNATDKYAALSVLNPIPPVDPANCYHGGPCVLGQKCKANGQTCICDNDTQNPQITRFYCSTPGTAGGHSAN